MRNEFFDEVLTMFMNDSGLDEETCIVVLVTYVKQSTELLEDLKKALLAKDYSHASELLHRLKGSSGNVRARRIMTLALESERSLQNGNLDEVTQMMPTLMTLVGHLKSALSLELHM